MDHPMQSLIDRIVAQAEAEGKLKDLEGQGEPLPDRPDPKDAVLNRLMTEHRAKPRIVLLQEKVAAARSALAGAVGEEARRVAMKALADAQLDLELEKEAIRRYG